MSHRLSDNDTDDILALTTNKRKRDEPAKAPRIGANAASKAKRQALERSGSGSNSSTSQQKAVRKSTQKNGLPILALTQLHNSIDAITPRTSGPAAPAQPKTAAQDAKAAQRIRLADPTENMNAGESPTPAQVKGISGKAVYNMTAKVSWQEDCAVSRRLKAFINSGDLDPETEDSRICWSVTKLADHKVKGCAECERNVCVRHFPKTMRLAVFFPFDGLFPEWQYVFAVIEHAEIRLYRIDQDRGIEHISTALDVTANVDNLPAPKRANREEFLSLAWTYAWWLDDEPGDSTNGTPLLLAAGATGVVKIYRSKQLQFVRALVGHGGPIHSISVSPQQPWLVVTASHDRTLRIWNLLIDDQPCVAILGGHGGHTKEVLAAAWHPTRNIIASGGIDRYFKLWAVPEKVYEQKTPTGVKKSKKPNEHGLNVRRYGEEYSSVVTSRRAVQVHDPITSTNYIHWDHIEQIIWADELSILTKARSGRISRDFGRRNGNAAEIILWRTDLLRELFHDNLPKVVDDFGIRGSPRHEGAFRMLKRFVIPKQGYWGPAMGFDGLDTIALAFQGGLWECQVSKAPERYGLTYAPPRIDAREYGMPAVVKNTNEWEQIAPVEDSCLNEATQCAAYSSDGEYVVSCGEHGMIVCWRRADADDVSERGEEEE